jgi:Ion channel
MSKSLENTKDKKFYKLLFSKTALPIIFTIGIGLLYVVIMATVDHENFPFAAIVMVLALVKTVIIAMTTLKQVSKLMIICHSMEQLLWVFGLLIIITIFSSASDYTCLFLFDHESFAGVPLQSEAFFYQFYNFVYFSVITFSTVGFGGIIPVSEIARFVVMLEIFLSFFIIVFAFANINKVHINE